MSDNRGCERAVTPVVPPWDLWFPFQTPVVPELYWNVLSSEQRYKQLCCTLQSLIDYSKLLADGLNDVTQDVREQLEAQSAWVASQIAQLDAELRKLIEQVAGSSMDWDVTAGDLDSSQTAHRALYWWLTPHGLTVGDFNGTMGDLTVSDLADSGLNCQGWAQYGGAYLQGGIASVPVYYRA